MFTRKQRLAEECTHREYFGQFVTPALTSYVVAQIGGDRLLASTDPHLNDIPLQEWDDMQMAVRNMIGTPMAKIGITGISLSDCVCAAKEAAHQWIEAAKLPPNPESETTKSLYERMVEAGVKIDHHYSDLQVESTEISRDVIAAFKRESDCPLHIEYFSSAIDKTPWIEIAFMYDPHFNRVAIKK